MEPAFKVILISSLFAAASGQGSYYSSFSGPVSGAVDEILVPGPPGYPKREPTYDFVAKPDYSFGYGVSDPDTGNAQRHEEVRDGDTVRGQYSVVEPDGTVRTVSYSADPENGFRATVQRKAPLGHPDFDSLPDFFNGDDYSSEFDTTYSPEYGSGYSPGSGEAISDY